MDNFWLFLAALGAAVAVGFASVALVLTWVLHFREGLAWDGGAAEFNWHPVLVVTGFVFLSGLAIIVFRLPWTWQCSKQLMKFIHAGLHMLAFVLTVISMVAVFDFHNTAKIPNMYSLHSWVGLTALILYTLQILFGVALYLMPFAPVSWRAAFMPVHIYSGLFIFTSVIAVALMGITEKLIFALSNPKYKDSPPEATFVNIIGMLLVIFGGFILFIVTQKSWKRPSEQILHNPTTRGGGGRGLSQLSEEIESETSCDFRKRISN